MNLPVVPILIPLQISIVWSASSTADQIIDIYNKAELSLEPRKIQKSVKNTFEEIFHLPQQHYKIPSRSTITRWLEDKYEVLSPLLRSKLTTVENLTLTSDIGSDMQMRSFLGVTAHFALGTEFQSVTLGVYLLNERHTSEYYSRKASSNLHWMGI